MAYLDLLVPNRGLEEGSLQSLAYRAIVESESVALPTIPSGLSDMIGPVMSWLRQWCEWERDRLANQVVSLG